MLLLFALVAGGMSSWAADEVFYTLTPAKGTNSGYTNACNVTINGITWNLTGNSQQIPWRIGGKSLKKVDRALYSKTAISDNVTKIEVTHGEASGITVNSWTVIVSKNSDFSDPVSTLTPSFKASTTTTINRPAGKDWTNCYYKFIYNVTVSSDSKNKFIEFSKAAFYKESGSSTVATPTFSPVAGAVVAGTKVSINCSTDGAAIHYTTDGTDPTSSSATYSTPIVINEAQTIKAIAVKAGMTNSVIATADYTVIETKKYNLVKAITSGKHYVITNGKDGSVKVLDSQSSNNRASIDAEITSGILNATGACELLIQGPNADGYYTIYDVNNNGYLYAASSSSNYLRNKSELDSNGTWSIEISGDGVATIKAKGTNTRNWIRNNGNLFSCYASGQSDVYLFEKDGESAPEESVTIGSAGYATYCSNNALNFAGSGITAYMAKASGSSVTLTAIEDGVVPAREGVVLKGSANTYNVAVATALGSDYVASENEMVGLVEASTVDAIVDGKYNYILSNEDAGVGFYKAVNGVQLAANKAYLSTTVNAAVRGFLGFTEDDSDAIIEIAKTEKMSAIYDLSGRRVVKPTKGLYIVNGKKVVK